MGGEVGMVDDLNEAAEMHCEGKRVKAFVIGW